MDIWKHGILLVTIACTVISVKVKSFEKRLNEARLQIKLIDGDSENEGFIIVKRHGQWFYQCDRFWGSRNSKVVCREQGYSKVVATQNASAVNKRMRDIEFDEYVLNCESNEKILAGCQQKPVKNRFVSKHCMSETRVYIICHGKEDNDQLFPTYKKENSKMRLDNGEMEGEITRMGTLQVLVQQEWKDVCVDDWSAENSLVACKQLGFPTHGNYSCHPCNNSSTPFFTFDLSCSGDEGILWECQQNEQLKGVCKNMQSVQLECLQVDVEKFMEGKNNEVRLRGGYVESEGRVEVFMNGEWGTICDDGWDIKDASVICRQLGFGSPFQATHWADHGEGLGKIAVTNISCKGNESSIYECKSSLNTSTCTHSEDAGIRCHGPTINSHNVIRLVGGNEYEGRIEFLRNGRWDGICGIGFARHQGEIVCRQLGLGFVEWASRSYKYGVNYRKSMYDVRCHGNETNLLQCDYQTWGRCRYYDMASVKCSKYAADLVMEISEFQKSIIVESNTLRQLKCAYEERCLSLIVDQFYNKNRMLKRKLLKFTSSFMNKGAVSFRSHLAKDAWKWHSCHDHYHSMETFATYDLIDGNGTLVADGHKASFCLEDTKCNGGYKKYFNCTEKGDQGISVNCVDVYNNKLDCQWIDITEVKDGNYSLRVVVNPLKSVTESDYSNNRAVCSLEYHDGKVTVNHCTTDACYQESFGGNSYGHCCTFPFTYKNQVYYRCTKNDKVSNAPWCATTHNFDQDGKWGYCQQLNV